MRRTAVLSACAVVGAALLVPATALAADDGPSREDRADRWIAVEDQFAAVLPDGTTYDAENPPPEEALAFPVGARLFLGEALYDTEDGTTPGDLVGRTHIECTAQVLPDDLLCDIAFVFDEGSQLHGRVHVAFSEEESDVPEQFDIAVTGGTDEFSDARGEVSLLDITDPDDPEAMTTTLYEAHLG